jgi:hypothetical protein
MANKRFTQTEVLDRIAADSDSEVEIELEDDGWPSSDDESSDEVSRSRAEGGQYANLIGIQFFS